MRYLYTLILYLLIPVVLLRLCWRAMKAPAYARRWAERFGCFSGMALVDGTVVNGPVIWIHAVSVGETLAALPMIKALQERHTNAQLVVTTTTPTGSERVRAALGDSVFHVYAPYDLPDCIARFLHRVKPQLLVIMETELWPNTIAACHSRKIPVVVANARLSAKSAKGYQRFSAITRPMLQHLTKVAAQHLDDAGRFQSLGLTSGQCEVTGSIKFDLTLDENLKAKASELKASWSQQGQRLICLAASTHQGEDEQILHAFAQAKRQCSELLLVIVPRHPERFNRVAQLCQERFKVSRRSLKEAVSGDTDIVLGDTMGELLLMLGACDIAFIGGSLVSTGGHNMIEAAAWEVPVITGPHLFNFAEASRLLTDAGAMTIVEDADALGETLGNLAQDRDKRQQMGRAGKAVAEANRGALDRLLAMIDGCL